MRTRSHSTSLALFLVTALAGLAVRFLPLGLPDAVVKYGGSTLWAAMIYWIASAALPRWPLTPVALLAGSIATTVEFFKLFHSPAMDAFRHTLPGTILLGRHFSLRDIVAYAIAIGLAASLDARIRPVQH